MKYFLDTEFVEGCQEPPLMLKNRMGGWMFGYKSKPTIDLISIGIVAEDGREYYAISKDFNLREAWNRYQIEESHFSNNDGEYPIKVYWLRDNVLFSIYNELYLLDLNEALKSNTISYYCPIPKKEFTYKNLKRLIYRYGKSNKEIARDIYEFCTDEVIFSEHNGKFIGAVDPVRGNPEFYGYFADYDWVVFCWLFGKMNDLPEGFPYYCKDLKQIYEYHNGNFLIRKSLDAIPDRLKSYDNLIDHPLYPKQVDEHNALADARWNKDLFNFFNNFFDHEK